MKSEAEKKEYEKYVKQVTPVHSLPVNMAKAFLTGGLICVLGQALMNAGMDLGLNREDAGSWCSLLLVLLSALLTGWNIYPKLARFGGAGTLVPITGFANSVAAAAVEYQTEGEVFGKGSKIFSIAGPVYEGFFHLIGMEGDVEHTTLSYIIRDHDREKFEARKALMQECAVKLNEKYGQGRVEVQVKDQYYNMRQQVEPLMHIIDLAFAAMKEAGVEPKVKAIRGGTDGAQLSFKGLPCPNIFAGGLNFHGRYEFVPIQSIEKAMKVVAKIAELTAKRY